MTYHSFYCQLVPVLEALLGNGHHPTIVQCIRGVRAAPCARGILIIVIFIAIFIVVLLSLLLLLGSRNSRLPCPLSRCCCTLWASSDLLAAIATGEFRCYNSLAGW